VDIGRSDGQKQKRTISEKKRFLHMVYQKVKYICHWLEFQNTVHAGVINFW
jgi:hypothetical protein